MINDLLDEPVALATVILAIATFIAALHSSRSAKKSKKQTDEVKLIGKMIDIDISQANLLHEKNIFHQKISQYQAEEILRTLNKTEVNAAMLLSAIELVDRGLELTDSHMQSAIMASKRISFTYPPNTGVGEEVNLQIDHAIHWLFNPEDKISRKALTALQWNLWLVVNHERKRSIAAMQGLTLEDWESIEPKKIEDVP